MARHKAEEAEYNEVDTEVIEEREYTQQELMAALKPKAD